MSDEDFTEIRERLATVEGDIRWLKWVAMAAASSGVANLFLNAPVAQAVIAASAVFVVGVAADVIAHLR